MADFTLVIGNKNYSSWSLRGWLLAKQTGAPFHEELIWLDEDTDRAERRRRSPAGKVPVLVHDGFAVWDTLAIAEYLAELYPRAGIWPAERRARARARSVCAEMHSGFQALRSEMPMNISARRDPLDRGAEVARDVARVAELWVDARREHGRGGPYLFGPWCAADAFFAPVATRLVTYSVPVEGEAAAYRDALLAHEWVREWSAAAAREEHVYDAYAGKR